MIWGTLILAATLPMPAQGVDYYANLPKGASPQEVGKKVAEHFVASPHQSQQTIGYAEVCTWYGALTFAQLTHDEALRKELIARFAPLMPGGAEAVAFPTIVAAGPRGREEAAAASCGRLDLRRCSAGNRD